MDKVDAQVTTPSHQLLPAVSMPATNPASDSRDLADTLHGLQIQSSRRQDLGSNTTPTTALAGSIPTAFVPPSSYSPSPIKLPAPASAPSHDTVSPAAQSSTQHHGVYSQTPLSAPAPANDTTGSDPVSQPADPHLAFKRQWAFYTKSNMESQLAMDAQNLEDLVEAVGSGIISDTPFQYFLRKVTRLLGELNQSYDRVLQDLVALEPQNWQKYSLEGQNLETSYWQRLGEVRR